MKYLLIIILFTSCVTRLPVKHFYETDERFRKREILLPDSVHSSTLRVIHPRRLEKAIILAECWEDVQEGLRINCKQAK